MNHQAASSPPAHTKAASYQDSADYITPDQDTPGYFTLGAPWCRLEARGAPRHVEGTLLVAPCPGGGAHCLPVPHPLLPLDPGGSIDAHQGRVGLTIHRAKNKNNYPHKGVGCGAKWWLYPKGMGCIVLCSRRFLKVLASSRFNLSSFSEIDRLIISSASTRWSVPPTGHLHRGTTPLTAHAGSGFGKWSVGVMSSGR